jgi:ubiquinone/menaquinone biosynthesis C-methylase UbiE
LVAPPGKIDGQFDPVGGVVEPDILAYYNQGREQARLESIGRLEFLRTQELLGRYLPRPPAAVLDVGGGAGIHAQPLLAQGYAVTLIDPVELHVEQARAAGVTDAVVGDARDLRLADAVADAVMLLGPLYHLTENEDRVVALTEARRVTRRGGILIAACISRFASTYDGVTLRYLDDPAFEGIAGEDVESGQHRNPERRPGWFTTAYLHRPDDVVREVTDAGWSDVSLLAVEGPGTFGDPDFWLDGSGRQATLLRAIRRVESEPSILGASPHLLVVASNH